MWPKMRSTISAMRVVRLYRARWNLCHFLFHRLRQLQLWSVPRAENSTTFSIRKPNRLENEWREGRNYANHLSTFIAITNFRCFFRNKWKVCDVVSLDQMMLHRVYLLYSNSLVFVHVNLRFYKGCKRQIRQQTNNPHACSKSIA